LFLHTIMIYVHIVTDTRKRKCPWECLCDKHRNSSYDTDSDTDYDEVYNNTFMTQPVTDEHFALEDLVSVNTVNAISCKNVHQLKHM
jgi:hypothetical protein